MKSMRIFLMLLLGLLGVAPQTMAQLDSEGYPEVYLRGTSNGWRCEEATKFQRTGTSYFLHLDHLEGEFKIADPSWTYIDYGADEAGTPLVQPMTIASVRGGANIPCYGLDNVDIYFEIHEAELFAAEMTVWFGVDGVWASDPGIAIPTPEPTPDPSDPDMGPDINEMYDWEGYPIAYIRGNVNGWQYGDPAYRFSRNGTTYSIHLDHLDGQFKVGDANWELINLGADPGSSPVVSSSQVIPALYHPISAHNFEAANLHNVTISFAYDPSAPHSWGETVMMSVSINGEDPGDIVVPPTPYPTDQISQTLPVLYLNFYKVDADGKYVLDANGNRILENEVIDKDLSHKNYFTGEYWLDCTYCSGLAGAKFKSIGSADEPLPLEMKARGNWTRRGFAKKPFKLKLGKKQNLLDLTPDKSKHYAILAHADDNYGYLRNFVGFDLGRRIGLPWTPSQQPVEVVINGNYRGLYFLTESIRVGDGRIDVTELKDNSENPDEISGAYLVEIDNYDEPDDAQIRMNEESCAPGHYLDVLRITFNTPEVYSPLMRRFVTEQFSTMNTLIGLNNDAIWTYLDLDDAVRYYIVREIISDVESFHGSTYLFRDRGEGQKWHFSPLWDHGNAFNGHTGCFFYDCDPFGNTWIPSLRCNEMFNDKLAHTWTWFMGSCYEGLEDDINAYVDAIRSAAKADAKRWGSAPYPIGGVGVIDNSDMSGRRDAVLSHLRAKTAWLAGQWGQPYHCAEPERDNTPAAPLPDYAKSGVENVQAAASAAHAAEMFDLMGRPVANPAPGSVVIVRSAAGVEKQIVR